MPVIFLCKNGDEPERRGPAWATLWSAAERMKRERVGAAVEKIEEMGRRAPKIFSGTARGVAKQLQIPPSAPTKKELLSTKSSFFVYPSRRLGISSDASRYIISPCRAVSHHALACIFLRLDDIQHFVLVICNFCEIDDIQGLRLDLG